MEYTNIIVHYDEIGLKKGNRMMFEKKLVDNIKVKLSDYISKIVMERGQIILDLKKFDKEKITNALDLTAGISSFLFTKKSTFEIEDITRVSLELFEKIKPINFRVETKRHNKSYKFISSEINEKVGKVICEKYDTKVKLKNPVLYLHVEICNKNAYIGFEKIRGIGGLGIDSADPMLCLLSGGIDSPVAAFLMMKRGVKVTFIHFRNNTQMKRSTQSKIQNLVERLSEIQGKARLITIPFEKIQQEIIVNINSKYRMIIYRRFMMRIADLVAQDQKIEALITGDSLSQVASQTVANISSIYCCAQKVVLSPLIGLNKNEIINISKKIGTYEISILPYNDCCSFFIAKNPEVNSRRYYLEKMETDLDVNNLVKIGFDGKIVTDFSLGKKI